MITKSTNVGFFVSFKIKDSIMKLGECMKNYFFKIYFFLFVPILFIEIFFKMLNFPLFDFSMVRILLFSFFLSGSFAFIISFFREKTAKKMILLITFVYTFYAFLQIGLFNLMGNYLSFGAGEALGRVFEFTIDFIKSLKLQYFIFFLPLLLLIYLFIRYKKILKYKKMNNKERLVILMGLALINLLSLFTLNISSKTQVMSNKELYKNPTVIGVSLRQFGTGRFMWLDIKNLVIKRENATPIDVPDPDDIIVDPERKIDYDYLHKLMENETDKTVLELYNYYLSVPMTPRNDMTGYFEGKNLIYIMVEAFDMAAINKDLTPNLYKMANQGWYFENFFVQEHSCATGESEFVGLVSIVPLTTVCTPNSYKNNTHPQAIFNLFNKKEYYSTSYHNWKDQYYERKIIHKNMGSKYFYNHGDLKITSIGGWPSDLELMQKALPHFKDEKPFFSFIISSTMHFPYDHFVGVVSRNWSQVKDLEGYSSKLKYYMAKSIDFDKSLGHLMNELEKEGKLNDTVFILYGDHHPLGGMTSAELNIASNINRTKDLNRYVRPLIIYNSDLEPTVFSQVGSTYDIVPTIANLFDLDYDPRLYVGKDLFSDEEKIAFFPNGNWITDKAMYFSSKNTYKSLTEEEIDDQYIKEINNKIKNIINVSTKTLNKNYFKYIR
jgi:lipoteichoic acid synthase